MSTREEDALIGLVPMTREDVLDMRIRDALSQPPLNSFTMESSNLEGIYDAIAAALTKRFMREPHVWSFDVRRVLERAGVKPQHFHADIWRLDLRS